MPFSPKGREGEAMNKTLLEIAKGLKKEGVQCNCDLDNWEPLDTGHTSVCQIHKVAKLFWTKNMMHQQRRTQQ